MLWIGAIHLSHPSNLFCIIFAEQALLKKRDKEMILEVSSTSSDSSTNEESSREKGKLRPGQSAKSSGKRKHRIQESSTDESSSSEAKSSKKKKKGKLRPGQRAKSSGRKAQPPSSESHSSDSYGSIDSSGSNSEPQRDSSESSLDSPSSKTEARKKLSFGSQAEISPDLSSEESSDATRPTP